jgi:hypothetical protein
MDLKLPFLEKLSPVIRWALLLPGSYFIGGLPILLGFVYVLFFSSPTDSEGVKLEGAYDWFGFLFAGLFSALAFLVCMVTIAPSRKKTVLFGAAILLIVHAIIVAVVLLPIFNEQSEYLIWIFVVTHILLVPGTIFSIFDKTSDLI